MPKQVAMNKIKRLHFFGIVLITFSFALTSFQSQAATSKSKQKPSPKVTKERVVMMPIHLSIEDQALTDNMESAVVEGLQEKYEVLWGEDVHKKARAIYEKENLKHECDDQLCAEKLAGGFQTEILAVVRVVKQSDGYYLSLNIQNVFDHVVIYTKSLTCEGCTAFKVIDKLKELSGNGNNTEASEAALAAERKAKAEELKQEQLVFEEKLRNADVAERKRLLDAKAEDDEHIATLKAQAEAKRKIIASQAHSDFPTIDSAHAEINRLKESVAEIESGYAKELEQTRNKINERFAAELAGVEKNRKDEFETTEDFNANQNKKRFELRQQRDEELASLSTNTIATGDFAPLRDKIKELSEREYTLSNETMVVNLGTYDADTKQFPVSINSKVPHLKFEVKGTVTKPIAEAKVFKQQWVAGLVRAEVKMNPSRVSSEIALVSDADNSRLIYYSGRFMNSKAIEDVAAKEKEREKEKAVEPFAGVMVHIPNQNYEMGKYDVTQAQWHAVMGTNPSHFFSCGDNCPVETVSWNDVQVFIQRLNAKTGSQYRLPTEEEWEYACFGRNRTEYCGGDELDRVAWYDKNSNNTTHPVGQKQENGFGLYDMSGNVWQWMANKYDNEHGWRELRGGSWFNYMGYLRATDRSYGFDFDPASRKDYVGFRLARTIP